MRHHHTEALDVDVDEPVPYVPTDLPTALAMVDRLVLDLALLTGVPESVIRIRYGVVSTPIVDMLVYGSPDREPS
ncbi:hypothetical protein EXU48_15645 [Occultella glacieicola]|uniref:Uncharacterized protein n=1 Tax=Occultella glacieicola TaxID=2518684 RepID=A0ABY2E491_9MICO|nr:hypothetical protein [Occultella glacieicola]TDE91578.1 hypothetical protein EXU48_15645 [Occultella glacieicola]